MTDLEAARMKVKCLELVEHSTMAWWLVARNATDKKVFPNPITFCGSATAYEIALGLIEGKPVWQGDMYRSPEGVESIAEVLSCKEYWERCSWNPPKPTTLTIELDAADIEYWVQLGLQLKAGGYFCTNVTPQYTETSLRFYAACQKALETRK